MCHFLLTMSETVDTSITLDFVDTELQDIGLKMNSIENEGKGDQRFEHTTT